MGWVGCSNMGPKLILGNPMNDRGGIHDHGIVHIPSDKGLGFLAPHKNRNVKPLTWENLYLPESRPAKPKSGGDFWPRVDLEIARGRLFL